MSTVSELGLGEPCLEMSIEVRRIFLKLRHGCKECQDSMQDLCNFMLACPYLANSQLISGMSQNLNITIIVSLLRSFCA
jgi:hypothetical protein